MITQEPDVQEESSPQESGILIDGVGDNEAVDSVEEVVEETPNVEDVKEEPKEEAAPPQKVPLTRLKKEIAKRKELELQIANFSNAPASGTNTNENVAQATTQAGRPKRPTLKDSEYDEEAHEAAMEKYDSELGEYQFAQFEKRSEEKAQGKAQAKRATELDTRVENLYNTDVEYKNAVDEIMDNDEKVSYSDVVREAIGDGEEGVLLDRYLLINRAEMLPKLDQMTPMQQAMEMGRISAIVAQSKKEVQEPKHKASSAPDPIDTSTGSGNVPSSSTSESGIFIY